MSNTKTVMGQASNQYVAPLDITDVFSTYLWSGTGATQTITNGIDLAGEGGMVWAKSRNNTYKHSLYDTERGTTKNLSTNSTASEVVETGVTSFNSSGFNIGSWAGINLSGDDVASWTFRKAPKFFDVVTYTGDGVFGRSIPHNLGCEVGMLVVKRTDASASWYVYHRGVDATAPQDYTLVLDLTLARINSSAPWADTAPTTTHFTVGDNSNYNESGATYVAYLFAHNDGDGGFGPSGDQDIIKCGSYTGNGADARTIDLGFEAQWVLLKRSDGATDWWILDNMRGLPARPEASQYLEANTANAEAVTGQVYGDNQGFMVDAGDYNTSGENYIYMAIRRGPLAQPESGTEVFAMDTRYSAGSNPAYRSGWPVDMDLVRIIDGVNTWSLQDRLRGKVRLSTNSTDAESTWDERYDFNNGWGEATGADPTRFSWMWKRAPGFFDAVAYTGTGSARTVSHNLGVAPEMIWAKRRDAAVSWPVFHKQTGSSKRLFLNSTNAEDSDTTTWNAVDPTATDFTVGTYTGVNASGGNYIAYLFATLPGISKVGSVSHTSGSATNVDCGFTSGARFILLKVTDSSGSWFVYDTTRGIVAGNDARLKLDSTAAENTGNDDIDPLSSGFTITSTVSTGSYIFYAIA